MRPLFKWLLRMTATAVGLVVVFATVLALILNTASGTRWAIERAAAALPGELRIEQFDGTLWHGLTIGTLVYRDMERTVDAVNVDLRINWPAILAGKIAITLLSADYVDYDAAAVQSSAAEPFEFTFSPLPVSIDVRHASINRVVLSAGDATTEIRTIVLDDAELDSEVLQIGTFSATTETLALTLTDIRSRLSNDVPVKATLSWTMSDDTWSGRGNLQGSLAALQFEQAIAGPYPAQVSGTVQILHRSEPEIDARVRWDSWMFGDITLDNGDVGIKGIANRYAATYDASLQLPGQPPFEISGAASGDTEGLATVDASLHSPGGNANFKGSLSWLPAFGVEGVIRATDVDPAAVSARMSGIFNADARITLDEVGSLLLREINIAGTLNEVALVAHGDLALTPEQATCSDCSLTAGNNYIQVAGTYRSEAIDFSLTIQAPSLDRLLPGLTGSVAGSGRLLGTAASPKFTGEFSASRLQFGDWSMQELTLNSREFAADALDIMATATNLGRGETELGSFSVHAQGRTDLLDIELEWLYRDLETTAEFDLRQADDRILGRIREATISEPQAGSWSLSEPASFRIDGDDIVVDPHSWVGSGGELRVERLSRSGDALDVSAQLIELPLQLANSFLPQNYQLDGFANAELELLQRSGSLTGSLDWSQSATIVHISEAFEQSTDISIPQAELRVDLANDVAQVAAAVAIEPGVTARLDAEVTQLTDNPSIAAEIRMQGEQWQWISAVIPEIDDFEGVVAASIRAIGPLRSPKLSGDVTWRQGSLAVPALNVPFRKIDLVVAATSDGSATLIGTAKAGDGDLAIDGRLSDLMQPSQSLTLRLTGDTAELINWPEYRFWASPDVVISAAAAGWQVNGQLQIPRAEVSLRELPVGAVKPSPDVVISGETIETQQTTRYSGEITLVLGERVHLQALGLDSNLTGSLLVRKAPDRAPTAEGRIELVGGIFSAYGQKLTIETGTLTFTGPLDDPIVDVRAVRIIESFDETVTAGIQLRGRANNLTSTIFSDPAMGEADALSYLVIGRPLAQATEAEGGNLSGAAIGLGLKQATRITEQIGQTIGLDQLSLTGDGGDNTALIAGKQISPELYARYVYNVFSRLGTLLVQFKLSQHLTLEASAGETQSIDVLYSIEK